MGNKEGFELVGPMSPQIRKHSDDALRVFNVVLHDRHSRSQFNPVGVIQRHIKEEQEAVLLIGVQGLEIFTTIIPDEEQTGGAIRTTKRVLSRPVQVGSQVGRQATHIPQRLAMNLVRRLPLRKSDTSKDDEVEEPADMQLPDESDLHPTYILEGQHTFSVGIAFAQIIKVIAHGSLVTVFYHSNILSSARLSKNDVATAMRVTFCCQTEQGMTAVLGTFEWQIGRYERATRLLSLQLALRTDMHIIALTGRLSTQGQWRAGDDPDHLEEVIVKDAPWGTTIPAPASWATSEEAENEKVFVYIMTPLGYGKAEVSYATARQYRKGVLKQGNEASFFVGVVLHPGAPSSGGNNGGIVRRVDAPESDTALNDLSEDNDSGEGEWQPDEASEDSDENSMSSANSMLVSPPCQVPRLPRLSRASRSSASGGGGSLQSSNSSSVHQPSLGRPSSSVVSVGSAPGGKHVRLHCAVSFAPSDFADTSATDDEAAARNPGPTGGRQAQFYLAAAALVLLLLLYRLLSTATFYATLLNGAMLAYSLHAQGYLSRWLAGFAGGRAGKQGAPKRSDGLCTISFLKAEVIDDAWTASGSSLEGDLGKEEADPDEQKQRLAEEYGFTKDVVERFTLALGGDTVQAKRRMRATFEWKQANGLANILQQPQPNYRFFKDMFRHGVIGKTREGHPIWLLKVGDMKKGYQMYKSSKLKERDLAHHVAFVMDYMYNVLDPELLPGGSSLWILDLKGMGMTDVGSDAFQMGKTIALMIGNNYPERLYRTFVVNVPGFFSLLWKLVEPMLSASTRRKIRLLRSKKDMLETMMEEMQESDVPEEYGGTNTTSIYESIQEKELQTFADGLNSKGIGPILEE